MQSLAASTRLNARPVGVAGSRQAVKGSKPSLVVPHAVKDVFMPALRWAGAAAQQDSSMVGVLLPCRLLCAAP